MGGIKDMNQDNFSKCSKCEKNPASDEPHECPYSCEIADDYEFQCNCCDDCIHECCMDI